MANVIINDTNLTNIASAIREKNGTTDTYKPSEMAEAILAIQGGGGGGYEPTDEELTYASPDRVFAGGNNAWVLKEFGDRIYFESAGMGNTAIFGSYPYEVFDANITFGPNCFYMPLTQLFYDSGNKKALKEITGTLRSPNNVNGKLKFVDAMNVFANCENLRTIRDDFIDSSACCAHKTTSSSYNRWRSSFYGCYSLREIPKFYFEIMKLDDGSQIGINGVNYGYGSLFEGCYALNKIDGLFVISGMNNGNAVTSNMFSNTFHYCYNIHKFTFETNPDGTPMTGKWQGQIIDLYTSNFGYGGSSDLFTRYNSGLLAENKINTIVSADTPHYYATDEGLNTYFGVGADCAKFGHTEAVELINSLPDTTSVGGGNNTLKLRSNQGKYTDYLKGRTNDSSFDSSISTLTEEEIAVAAAKGWTVTLS